MGKSLMQFPMTHLIYMFVGDVTSLMIALGRSRAFVQNL
mgnify:CR=1 FL=1